MRQERYSHLTDSARPASEHAGTGSYAGADADANTTG